MALADSGRAIGAVTRLLQTHLIRRAFGVSVGPPNTAAGDSSAANKLNLFLYQTDFDASLRNVGLLDDQPAPLWLSLHFLITAFDDENLSDSPAAHELLGRGLAALHELNYLRLDAGLAADVRAALENNPEPLKITFEETPADLLSKLMQGSEEHYRLSVSFQVRPIMIAPEVPPSVSLLVGVDYTQAPPEIIGLEGVGLAVLAGLGPKLDSLEPLAFEPAAPFVLNGEDLHASGLECLLGNVTLEITGQRPDRLEVLADGSFSPPATEGPIAAGSTLSAGEHPLLVRQLMPNNRYRSSNLLTARLLPVLESANLAAGTLTLGGLLLGTVDDDILVAFYRDGATVRVFDTAVPGPTQKQLTLAGVVAQAPPGPFTAGDYRVVLLVNGQQARMSPTVTVA
ncbi:MAG: DUF4255 domain-containing protein [Pseudomonadota bacterium]